ncbi:hypothetical protein AAIH25_15060 [Arthrobacter crystallopoietes]
MAENWKDRITGGQEEKSKNIQDWMYGSGGKALGGIAVALVLYFVVSIFI